MVTSDMLYRRQLTWTLHIQQLTAARNLSQFSCRRKLGCHVHRLPTHNYLHGKNSYTMTVNTKGAPAVRASLFPTYAHAIPTYHVTGSAKLIIVLS